MILEFDRSEKCLAIGNERLFSAFLGRIYLFQSIFYSKNNFFMNKTILLIFTY